MARLLVPRLATPPPLDGLGRAGSWAAAASVGPFKRHDGQPASLTSTALLGYDQGGLYVACPLADDDVWGSYRADGEPLYEEEVVEVFVDPSGAGLEYYELEVSPHNAVLTGRNSWATGRLRFTPDWDCAGLVTCVAVDGTLDDPEHEDHGWSVTLALPFTAFGVVTPRPGEVWRANLYRIDRSRRGRGEEFQAWSPTQAPGEAPDFNVPARFGWIEFAS